MQLQLLTGALRRRPEFQIAACSLNLEEILHFLASSQVDVLLLAPAGYGSAWQDMAILRRIHISFPKTAKILVLESADRELVVNGFRSGARGLFCFSVSQFRSLCKCIQVVHRARSGPRRSRSTS
jgi:DNA-binding NarL/FixJ family response regulator